MKPQASLDTMRVVEDDARKQMTMRDLLGPHRRTLEINGYAMYGFFLKDDFSLLCDDSAQMRA